MPANFEGHLPDLRPGHGNGHDGHAGRDLEAARIRIPLLAREPEKARIGQLIREKTELTRFTSRMAGAKTLASCMLQRLLRA